MKRVILISEHYYESKRKAGFHFLAEAYWRAGWEVIFVTSYVSYLSLLRGESRFPKPLLRQIRKEAKQLKPVRDRFCSYVWFTPWHPLNFGYFHLGFLNRLSNPWFKHYGSLALGDLEDLLADVTLFIFESTPGLMLFDRFKHAKPEARFVYRVSDDLRMLRRNPVVLEAEERNVPLFDLVSTPSEFLYQRFSHLPNASLQYHGIDKEAYDRPTDTPYRKAGPHCVFVGISLLDLDFLERASRICPEFSFHILGPFTGLPKRDNVFIYGEIPFEETIPFVKHADVGLHTRSYMPGSESLTDSLKVHQYTYCQLSIVAPEFLKSSRAHMFYYKPGNDETILTALASALQFDRTTIKIDNIVSWDQLAQALAGDTW